MTSNAGLRRSDPSREMQDVGRTVERVDSVMRSAQKAGLLSTKSSRITGRVSAELVKQAKARTGIDSDTDLIEFALANLALQDDFAATLRSVEGTVPADLDLEF